MCIVTTGPICGGPPHVNGRRIFKNRRFRGRPGDSDRLRHLVCEDLLLEEVQVWLSAPERAGSRSQTMQYVDYHDENAVRQRSEVFRWEHKKCDARNTKHQEACGYLRNEHTVLSACGSLSTTPPNGAYQSGAGAWGALGLVVRYDSSRRVCVSLEVWWLLFGQSVPVCCELTGALVAGGISP
jgi:hypothetical protein